MQTFLNNHSVRGLRNNNPGNIRISSSSWLGKIKGYDTSFETFEKLWHGVRATMVNLNTYQSKYGLYTLREMLTRWAPANENDTDKYVSYVAGVTGYAENLPLDLSQKSVMLKVVKAIFEMELGQNNAKLITVETYDKAFDNVNNFNKMLPEMTIEGTKKIFKSWLDKLNDSVVIRGAVVASLGLLIFFFK
nr:hypothetical protein [uncultured Flavobacterium sp.]